MKFHNTIQIPHLRATNLQKKADICQYYDQNGTILSSMHTFALLTETNFDSATNFKGFSPQRNFRNCGSYASNCALPTSENHFAHL